VYLPVPDDFGFLPTVYSHGWYALPPFAVTGHQLQRVLVLPGNRAVRCTISAHRNGLRIVAGIRDVTASDRRSITTQVRQCLRLDEDFTTFHSEARRHRRFRWIAGAKAGRLLRSPTVFEDIVKTICTTNCTWSLTTLMVRNLVGLLGPRGGDGATGFPNAEAIAGSSERFLRSEVKAGYRSPYILEFAERVASRKLDPESLRSPDFAESLYESLRSIKGMGPYASESMLRLLGRYEHLALDSWVRSRYYSLHHAGRKVRDATIERSYAPFGEWKGLFFWLEMTRDALGKKIRIIPQTS
jgi:N-glycosylase/DNA lyase